MNPNLTNPEIVTRLANERVQELRRSSQPNPKAELAPGSSTARKGRSLRKFFFTFFDK
jgi:hypothetical protein